MGPITSARVHASLSSFSVGSAVSAPVVRAASLLPVSEPQDVATDSPLGPLLSIGGSGATVVGVGVMLATAPSSLVLLGLILMLAGIGALIAGLITSMPESRDNSRNEDAPATVARESNRKATEPLHALAPPKTTGARLF